MNSNTLRVLVGLTVTLLASVTALAQTGGGFSVTWSTLDSGGTSSGGNFALNGTIGQPDAGAMSGGAFAVSGGFWSGISEGAPRLSIRLAGAGTVILSWPNPSTGFVLEETANLNTPGAWSDVTQTPVVNGANKEVTLQATSQGRFFRLRQT